MNNINKSIKFFLENNFRGFKMLLILWSIFFICAIISAIFKIPYIPNAMAIGLASSAVTSILIFPFFYQYILFPYSINLGWKRSEYIKGAFLFNILTALILLVFLYTLSIILNLLGTGFSPLSFPSFYQFFSYILIAVGLTGILVLSTLIFYRFKLFYGLSFALIILSPFVLLRSEIVYMLQWQTAALLPSSAVFAAAGLLSAVLSNIIIRKTEVR